jgi:sugar (pentulose or hexulose) kinase
MANPPFADPLFLGIDVGTSGVRAAVIDPAGATLSSAVCPMPAPVLVEGRPQQDPEIWWSAVVRCLAGLSAQLKSAKASFARIAALAVDGTSGTMLLADDRLSPVTPGLMYNSACFTEEAKRIANHAPLPSAMDASSALARMLHLQSMDPGRRAMFCLHQADWIMARIAGVGGNSDENNVLKLGYNLHTGEWPAWFEACGVRMALLPRVHAPGTVVATVGKWGSETLGFRPDARVCAGTTDSVAAFLASGADKNGNAVTSLGTTLVIKLLSDRPVEDPARGVYSHRIGGKWLAGGASNSGGAVLRRYFALQDIVALSAKIRADRPSGCDFYPLIRPGERFPTNDPDLQPRLSPRPEDDARFLHGMLEGMARIEADGYRALASLGCPYPTRVLTAGGGAGNAAWSRIRERILGVPVLRSPCEEAAVGAARLAAGLARF